MIQLTRVSVGYSGELLHAEKLELEAGKVYALVGRNGIGKSTFIQTISGIQKQLAGEITMNGQLISEYSPREIFRRFLADKRPSQIIFYPETKQTPRLY